MLYSFALILVVGMCLGWISKKIKLPSLVGMLLTGVLFGPYVLSWIHPSVLQISAEIRKIALIIILTRAGLSLDLSALKKLGRPALFMCFLPATFELFGVLLLAPIFLKVSYLEALIMGAVLAAVSPAVVVPRMVKLMDEKYGTKEGIPQLILAGASVDDVYVIVLFTTFMGLSTGEKISVLRFVNIPVSIVLGILVGVLAGFLLSLFFRKVHMRDTIKVVVILCVSFMLVALEDWIPIPITFSALIAVMFIGISMQKFRGLDVTKRLSAKYNKLWVIAEVFLFVLVGASVNISYVSHVGLGALIVIFGALLFRMLGVFICVLGTKLSMRERLFTMISYTPKATVQAAIGGIPLAAGLACGDAVLTVAVIAILLTAPLGAFFIDLTYKKLLKKEEC